MKRQWLAYYILAFFVVGVVISIAFTLLTQAPVVQEERILETSDRFTTVWTLSEVQLPGVQASQPDTNEPFLVVENDCVIFLGQYPTGKRVWLQCLAITNGNVKWQVALSGAVNGITNNSSSVFVAIYGPPARNCTASDCDSIGITTYDIDSGTAKWSSAYEGILVISRMFADESTIGIEGSGGHGAYTTAFSVDTNTGTRVDYQQRVENAVPTYFRLSATAEAQGRIVSNVVAYQGAVYFLTEGAVLWVIDQMSGEVLGRATFLPNQPLLTSGDYTYLAVSGDTIVVYFEDNRQLLALRFREEGG